jgi:hypothetical protein
MKLLKILIIASMLVIAGCSTIFPTKEDRIAGYQNTCSQLGFTHENQMHSMCVLELEKSYQEGKAKQSSSSNGSSGNSFLCKDAMQRNDSGGIFVHC